MCEAPEQGDRFARFCRHVLGLLNKELPGGPINPYWGLYDDLGLDSVQAFEVIVIVETMAECIVPPVEVPSLYTLSDAFAYYQKCLTAGEGMFAEG